MLPPQLQDVLIGELNVHAMLVEDEEEHQPLLPPVPGVHFPAPTPVHSASV